MKYWDSEIPITITTKSNVLRWYPSAGKLQVSRPDWPDAEGAMQRGKTVVFDVAALLEIDGGAAFLRSMLK